MLNLRTLGFGLALALNDIITMPFVKEIVGGWPFYFLIIPMITYSLDPLLFYFALQQEGMAIMNLTWNLISNIVVTFLGIVSFKEQITTNKTIGIFLSFVALLFLTYEKQKNE